MTVCEAGSQDGMLREVVRETGVDSDAPIIDFVERFGQINPDLTVGVDVSSAPTLVANEGIAHDGVKLHGRAFILTPSQAAYVGLGNRLGLDRFIRPYRNGRDLASHSRGLLVIDLFGLSAAEVRDQFPEVYQHLLGTVKPERDLNNRESYRTNWWIFGEPRRELRPAVSGLTRFIVTVDTARHRVFQFLPQGIVCDDKSVIVASDDGFLLGVLSARTHVLWALRAGGWLGVGNDPVYTKTRTFDPFPFPAADDLQKQRIRNIAEDLDAHRKRVLAEHAHLTLTGLYNVRERLRAGAKPETLDPGERRIFDDGLVLILNELHDKLDSAVAAAYGWPADLADEDVLARLVALNKERAQEEARGLVRWLRPEYQIPRFGSPKEKAKLDLVGGGAGAEAPAAAGARPNFPADDLGQTAAVMAALASASAPLSADALAAGFKQGRKIAPKVAAVLAALARTGYVATPDRGRTFALRRAA